MQPKKPPTIDDSFVGTQLAWIAGESTPFTTSVRNYDAPPCVVFEYTFPEGAERTAHAPANGTQHGGNAYDLLTNFPAFTSVKAKEGVSWADAFINFQPHLAFGPNGGPAVYAIPSALEMFVRSFLALR